MKRSLLPVLVVSGVLFSSAAFAQETGGGERATANVTGSGATRTQEFNFTDELVSGQLVRPDGDATRLRRRGAGISLIRIREHFIPEMLKSVENL